MFHQLRAVCDFSQVMTNSFRHNEAPFLEGLLVIKFSPDLKNKTRYPQTWTVIFHHHRADPKFSPALMNGCPLNEAPCSVRLLFIMFSPDLMWNSYPAQKRLEKWSDPCIAIENFRLRLSYFIFIMSDETLTGCITNITGLELFVSHYPTHNRVQTHLQDIVPDGLSFSTLQTVIPHAKSCIPLTGLYLFPRKVLDDLHCFVPPFLTVRARTRHDTCNKPFVSSSYPIGKTVPFQEPLPLRTHSLDDASR